MSVVMKPFAIICVFLFYFIIGINSITQNVNGTPEVDHLIVTEIPILNQHVVPKSYHEAKLMALNSTLQAQIADLQERLQVLEPLLSTVYSRMKAYSVVTPSNPYVLDLVPANGRHVFATAVDSTDLARATVLHEDGVIKIWTTKDSNTDAAVDKLNYFVIEEGVLASSDSHYDIKTISSSYQCMDVSVGPYTARATAIVTPYITSKSTSLSSTARIGKSTSISTVSCIKSWNSGCVGVSFTGSLLAIDSSKAYDAKTFQHGISDNTGTVIFPTAFDTVPSVIVQTCDTDDNGITTTVVTSVSTTGFTFTGHHCTSDSTEASTEYTWMAASTTKTVYL